MSNPLDRFKPHRVRDVRIAMATEGTFLELRPHMSDGTPKPHVALCSGHPDGGWDARVFDSPDVLRTLAADLEVAAKWLETKE